MNPRAIAALCSLRRSPLTCVEVMVSIGDADVYDTFHLLADMQRARLATQLHSQTADPRWYIAELGAEYLDANGIGFSPEADCRVAQEKVTP